MYLDMNKDSLAGFYKCEYIVLFFFILFLLFFIFILFTCIGLAKKSVQVIPVACQASLSMGFSRQEYQSG